MVVGAFVMRIPSMRSMPSMRMMHLQPLPRTVLALTGVWTVLSCRPPVVHKHDPSLEPPIAGNWKMSFDDEFNGTTLNPIWHPTQVWEHAATVVGQGELEAYDASGVTVSGGQLRLTARADAQYGVPYVSGLVTTGGDNTDPTHPKFTFQYGYMEVSAENTQGPGVLAGHLDGHQ